MRVCLLVVCGMGLGLVHAADEIPWTYDTSGRPPAPETSVSRPLPNFDSTVGDYGVSDPAGLNTMPPGLIILIR
ncbi:MAG: hypothetical protein ACOX9C_03795 [Kiritimatiellia bacterium]|jgi:hypothetical protein